MSDFTDFVTAELPKRPFTDGDGTPGQILVRSSNPLAARQMVWADAPAGTGTGGYTAAEAISGHSAITLDANGKAVLASADVFSGQFVLGLSSNSAALNDNVQVVVSGIIEHTGWTFTLGQPVFLGLAGAITQSVPGAALFSKVIGIAVTATRINVNPQPAIFF